jgi:hypothetical protein
MKCLIRIKYFLFVSAALFLSGCFTNELIKNYDPAKTDIQSIRKINLKDGSSIDLIDSSNPLMLVKCDSKEIVYKTSHGELHTISAGEIYRVYNGGLDTWRSAFVVIGILAAFFIFIVPAITGIPFG